MKSLSISRRICDSSCSGSFVVVLLLAPFVLAANFVVVVVATIDEDDEVNRVVRLFVGNDDDDNDNDSDSDDREVVDDCAHMMTKANEARIQIRRTRPR